MRFSNPVAGWNALTLLSVVVLLGSLAFRAVVPPPKSKLNPAQRSTKETTIVQDTDKLREKATTGEAKISQYVWPGDAKLAEAEAMALVTKLAHARGVSLGAFRPQKSAEDAGVRRLPFTLSLEGPFPDVMKFLGDLETPGNRLAVKMLQVSSTDGVSDHVGATMTVVAFQELAKPESSVSKLASVPATARSPAHGPTTEVKATGVGKPGGTSVKKPESHSENLNKPVAETSQQG